MDIRPVYAVLTGDIIGSTRKGAASMPEIRETLAAACSAYRKAYPGHLHGDMDFFRGDSWQLLLDDPQAALEVSIYLRATLRTRKCIDSRIAIGIGPVDRIEEAKISQSTGDAFLTSGRALDDAQKSGSALVIGSSPWTQRQLDELTTVLHLCDGLVTSWTERQCDVVSKRFAHPGLTLKEIGELFALSGKRKTISQQGISNHLRALRWDAVQAALAWFRQRHFDYVRQAEGAQP